MKELSDIIVAYEKLSGTGKASALATVVGVSGSTYRRPGARMLFSESGRVAGLINAACLESDLSERARNVILSGKPELISYDTTSADDIVFGLGLGCNGTVEILMEPGTSAAMSKKIVVMKQSIEGDKPTVLATVIASDVSKGVHVGDCVTIDSCGVVAGTIADAHFASMMESDAKTVADLPYTQKLYSFEGGNVRAFIEVVLPPLPLLVFGAGPDAIPLVDAAKLLGWHVTVVDHRPAYATQDNVRGADLVQLAEPEHVPDHVVMTGRHVAVIMTHNFDKDRKLLKILLQSPVQYVGLLGPKSKLQTLLQNLAKEGFHPTRDQLERLHAPIGLDIGAETPEEIAVSIIAEIKAVLGKRSGGFLKDRQGAIH
jgi:xanthine/CO dehydrogenase XdhC/CoxF family maturation factor